MVIGEYTIEANRAIVEERLREANHARLVQQFRRCQSKRLGALITRAMAR
jgi:hypothetical protein